MHVFSDYRLHSCAVLALAGLTLSACNQADPLGPTAQAMLSSNKALSAAHCRNVAFKADGLALGPVTAPPVLGGFSTVGLVPTLVTLGPWSGMLSSYVTSPSDPTKHRLTLMHFFKEIGTGDAFWTNDRAICAPTGPDPTVCRINDHLNIVGGTGKFTNATGRMVNRGIADFTHSTLSIDIRGRVCGDGL